MFARTRTLEQAYAANLPRLLGLQALKVSNIYTLYWVTYLHQILHLADFQAIRFASIGTILGMILEAPTGWFADRRGRKFSLVLGSVCCMIGLTMYALATTAGIYLIGAVAIANVGWALNGGADFALAADSCAKIEAVGQSAKDRYKQFQRRMVAMRSYGQGLGALLGALIVGLFAIRMVIWVQVAAYGLMLLFALSIKSPGKHPKKVQHLGRVAWSLKRRRHLLATIIVAAALSGPSAACLWLSQVYFGHVTIDGSHLPLWSFGLLYAAYVLSPPIFGHFFRDWFTRRFGEQGSLLPLMVVSACSMIIMGLSVSIIGLLAVFGFFLVRSIQEPITNTIITYEASPEERATMLSIARVVFLGFIGGMVWTISGIGAHFGLAVALVAVGVLMTIIATGALLAMNISGPLPNTADVAAPASGIDQS